jgi:hypothetical protein
VLTISTRGAVFNLKAAQAMEKDWVSISIQ